MSTHRTTITLTLDLDFEVVYSPGYAGYTSGPPEECYEGAGPEIEDWECDTVSLEHERIIGARVRLLKSAGTGDASFCADVLRVVLEELGVGERLQEALEEEEVASGRD